MANDLIADFLTRVRNAIPRGKKEIVMPSSKMVESIAKILKEEGFISDFEVESNDVQNNIKVSLKYINGVSAITNLKRISKPGLRIYGGYRDLSKVKKGLGTSIVSTSKGIMTAKQAKDQKVGGEVVAEIW